MRLVRPVSPNICSNFQGVGVLSLKYILLDEGYRDCCSHASWREYPDNLDPWIPHRGRFLIRQHQLWWNVRRVLVSCDLIRTSTFGISKRVAQISKSGGLQKFSILPFSIPTCTDPIWLENIGKNVIETVRYLWNMLNDVSFDSEMEVSARIMTAVFHLMKCNKSIKPKLGHRLFLSSPFYPAVWISVLPWRKPWTRATFKVGARAVLDFASMHPEMNKIVVWLMRRDLAPHSCADVCLLHKAC